MSITISQILANSDATDTTSYTTASWTPKANTLYYMAVANTKSTTPDTATVSGNSLTWTTGTSVTLGSNRRLTIYRGIAGSSPTTGTTLIDYGANTQTGAAWSIIEIVGSETVVSLGHPNVQTVSNSTAGATSLTVTLAALADANNASIGFFAHQTNETNTPGSGYTELSDVAHPNPADSLMVEYKVPGSTTVDGSWATSSQALGIALEIRVAKTKSETIDISILQTKTLTTTLDIDIKKTQTKTQSVDVDVVNRLTKTTTLNVLIEQTKTKTTTLDVLLFSSKPHITIDILIKRTWYPFHNLDIKLSRLKGKRSFNADVLLKDTNKVTTTLDVKLINRKTKTHSLDFIAAKRRTKTHSMSVIVGPYVPTHILRQKIDIRLVKYLNQGVCNGISLNSICLTDHNREPIDFALQNKETSVKTVGNETRKYIITKKQQYTLSWKFLPAYDGDTIDGKGARLTIKNLVESNETMLFSFTDFDGTVETSTVSVVSFTESLLKRYDTYYWDVTLTLKEL